MKVHVLQIPEEGAHYEGEESSDVLELKDPHARARAVGPIRYSLDVGLSEGGLFATGMVSAEVECECVRCLAKFRQVLEVPDFACQIELEGREMVDLTEQIREDILLALPAHPHCDWSGENVCKADFLTEKVAVAEPLDDRREVWKTLDKLKL